MPDAGPMGRARRAEPTEDPVATRGNLPEAGPMGRMCRACAAGRSAFDRAEPIDDLDASLLIRTTADLEEPRF